ncbi:hypothetical protein HD553DRAFT_347534 [Filobasidium floriforme]|uniref:uncharacterized protein n=1 Tax=Filobasidium floriforme TaxID=5210 RepID=UPI001E8E3E85|nr:uncharacterized protein HD553DRAFT_347534 [Filobasidium floriforme]KAH8089527.1 hypothetical protein HD553DRAFT_347534 [Filobasidium floriforme]
MNVIREIGRINERELDLGGDGVSASWHDDYKESAYVFVGGLPYNLTEGDVITIFSQFGEIVDINMPRDRETHKAKGFSFLMYEDQRSTVLAVDNMNGAKVLGRTVRVDHVRSYKHPDKTNAEGERVEAEEPTYNAMPPLIGGDDDSDDSSDSDARNSADDEDPMAAYIRAQKREQKKARKEKKGKGKEKDEKKKRKHEGETKEERAARKREKREKKEGKRVLKLEDGGKERSEGKGRVKRESEGRRSIKRESEDRGSASRHRDESKDRERRYRDASPSRRSPPPVARRRSPDIAVKTEPQEDWRAGRQDTLGRQDRSDSARDRDMDRDRSYRQRDADRTMRQMDRSRGDDRVGDTRRLDGDRRPDDRYREYGREARYDGRPSYR